MELTLELKNGGFVLEDVNENDVEDFVYVEKVSHSKYVIEHREFFGEYNEEIIFNAFADRRKMTFFKKILWQNETVGFLSYDQKKDKIDNVLIKIIEKAQNRGIGTLFLEYLKGISKELGIPVLVVAIQTNPAQNLYKRLGFEFYKKQDVFHIFRYGCEVV